MQKKQHILVSSKNKLYFCTYVALLLFDYKLRHGFRAINAKYMKRLVSNSKYLYAMTSAFVPPCSSEIQYIS